MVERAIVDYVIVETSALGRLVNVHVPKGAGLEVSGHFLVVEKVKGVLVLEEGKKQVQCSEVI